VSKSVRLRPPRKIRPWDAIELRPGSVLSCAVLSTWPEWVGVDLESGAFVRAPLIADGSAAVGGEWSVFDVALVEVAAELELPDPARPEAITISGVPEHAGSMRRGAARRLLHRLAAPEQRWLPLLGTRGPSIAYVDLEVTTPSVVLVEVSPKQLSCFVRERGDVVCSFSWAGTTQTLPLLDERVAQRCREAAPAPLEPAALAAALGGKPVYLLVGLAAVRAGHAPKAVLSVLTRGRSRA
jgi:hypothetical protein